MKWRLSGRNDRKTKKNKQTNSSAMAGTRNLNGFCCFDILVVFCEEMISVGEIHFCWGNTFWLERVLKYSASPSEQDTAVECFP